MQFVVVQKDMDIVNRVMRQNEQLMALGVQFFDNVRHALKRLDPADNLMHLPTTFEKQTYQTPPGVTKLPANRGHGTTTQLSFLGGSQRRPATLHRQKINNKVKAVGDSTVEIKNYGGHCQLVYPKSMAANQLATLGGGCFWCLEAFYQRVKGVASVTSGYSGGHVKNPTMAEVYSGQTGHAEVVQLEFNPSVITYKEILEIFYVMHDPTTLNRQGNDVGEEYRSVIFYHDDQQKQTAETTTKTFASNLWHDPIVTQILPFKKFWPAGDDQQDFYEKNPGVGYCQVVIEPKIQKLRQKFAAKLK